MYLIVNYCSGGLNSNTQKNGSGHAQSQLVMHWAVIVFGAIGCHWAIWFYSLSCMSGAIFNPRSLLNSSSNILTIAHLYIVIWYVSQISKLFLQYMPLVHDYISIFSSVQNKLQSAMVTFCLSPFSAWTLLRAIFIRLSNNAGIMPVTSGH